MSAAEQTDLHRIEQRYRQLFDMLPHGIEEVDLDGRIVLSNAAHHRMHGYADGELVGRSIFELVAEGEERDRLRALLGALREDEPEPGHYTTVDLTKDGRRIDVRVDWDYRRDGDGRVIGFVGIVTDITEQRRAQQRLRAVFDHAAVGVALVDLRGRVVAANPALRDFLGYGPDELHGLHFRSVTHADDIAVDESQFAELLAEKRTSYQIDKRYVRKDGDVVWGRLSVSLIRNATGAPENVVATCEDITERKAAEEALQRHETHLRSLMENAKRFVLYRLRPLPAAEFEAEVVYVSPSIRDLMGIDDPMDFRCWFANIHPADAPKIVAANRRAVESGEPFDEEMRILHPERKGVTWIRAISHRVTTDGEPFFNGLIFDITKLKRAEEARRKIESSMQQAQRLESLGVLAGGIAHDFNNLLQGILGSAGLARGCVQPDDASAEWLENIETAALRASELTRHLLAYSGQERLAFKPVDLNAVVEEMVRLLRTAVSRSAVLAFDLSPGPLTIQADASQVRQIVMNLLTNASEALRGRAGTITVRTGLGACDADASGLDLVTGRMPMGDRVFLEVTDTGCGMDAATRDRIFDPFFTTKFTGRGLGLAAVHGIVRGHGGALFMQSEPGAGTTFRICFPCAADSQALAAAAPAAPGEPSLADRTVLVVDDDAAVRDVARGILESCEARVLTACDGVDALATLRAELPVDVVVLDLTMPRKGGAETYRELREWAPVLPVVLSSGYSHQETILRFDGAAEDPHAGFVQKPYRAADLLAEVMRAIRRD